MEDFTHTPVLLNESLAALNPHPNGRYVDATIGGAGHAAAILEKSAPTGWLFGCDRDGAAIEAARRRLAPFTGRFELRQGNYAQLAEWLECDSWDGVLMDLGVSSAQLDQAGRGFSFQRDEPLDMRMDPQQPKTAADLLWQTGMAELARIFWELGGERRSRQIARLIDQERREHRIETTGHLVRIIERVHPRRGSRIHPATRVFQALRMAVNEELEWLGRGLEVSWRLLKVGGRLVVITFHSGEDRLVKAFGRRMGRDYRVEGEVDLPEFRHPKAPELKWVQRKAVFPSREEQQANPRARSAQLRAFEKIYGT